jgi:dTDP-4-dehydrorhamnose reductase
MRVLIIGGTGMLGHKLYQVFKDHFDTFVTLRSKGPRYSPPGLFDERQVIEDIDVSDLGKLEDVVKRIRPDVVVNCVGIIKQLPESHDPLLSIATNSLLPHQLARMCNDYDSKMVHISTDCVFSGQKGMYTEDDNPDPVDLYGRSKLLGEISDATHALTIRTSIIGRELKDTNALVEWFLAQSGGSIKGYTNAIFSGLTTVSLADVVKTILLDHGDLHGLYHVSSEPISKYDLLVLLRDVYDKRIEIVPDAEVRIDRTLDSRRFVEATNMKPLAWSTLINKLASDSTPYDEWRNQAD